MKSKFILMVLVSAMSLQSADANTIDFLFGAGSFGRKASPIADCRSLMARLIENTRASKDVTWKDRVITERKRSFLNDKELIDEIKYRDEKLGIVNSKFSKEFDTRFYFTSTAKADINGEIPMVDKEAKALVIYFHGSGTSKASGANFAGKMNALAKLGYSSLSFDLPFHSEGSRNPMLAKTKEFSDYVDRIINSVRIEGQPVILVGHSFGPDIIAEYATRHPHGADALVMLSPGGFDKTTTKWFADKTVNMTKNFGEFEANNDGGRWAGMVTNDRMWSNPKAAGRVDPTIANPDLKIYVISGDREEYIPGELDVEGLPTTKPRDYDLKKVFNSFFSKVDVTIEPGVGHYIFAHTDDKGQDVVLRSILRAGGESLLDEKAIKKAYSEKIQRSIVDAFALRYSKDLFFRGWIEKQAKLENTPVANFVAKIVTTDDIKSAQKLTKIFDELTRFRMEELIKHIKSTENWAPDFFQANREDILTLGTKGHDGTRVQSKYFAYLAENENPNLVENYTVSKSVMVEKEAELKKNFADKAAKSSIAVVKMRLAKEEKFKNFLISVASDQGKTLESFIEEIVTNNNEQMAQELMKKYESTRIR